MKDASMKESAGGEPENTSVQEIQFYWQLAGSSDLDDFKQRILAVIDKLGFSDFSYGLTSAQWGAYGKVACSWSELLRSYIEREYYLHDMILHHCEHSEKPLFNSTVENYISTAPFQTEQFKCTMDIIGFYKEHDYHDFYSIPFKTQNGSGNAMFSVTTKHCSQPEFRQRVNTSKPVLHLLAEAVDFIGASKFPKHFGPIELREEVIITPKPLRLLETLAKKNMTLKTAAEKLCISLDTANKHIATAKKALGASTQASAVYMALKKGLISCDLDDN